MTVLFVLPHFFSVVYSQDSEGFPLNKCWSFLTDQSTNLNIASDNVSRIFYPLKNGTIKAFDYLDGVVLWKTELGGEIVSDILYHHGKIFVATESGTESSESRTIKLRSIGEATGLPVWQQDIQIEDAGTGSKQVKGVAPLNLFIIDSYLYLLESSGRLTVLDSLTGNIEKQVRVGFDLSSKPIIQGTNIYVATAGNEILQISSAKFEVMEVLNLGNPARSIYAVGGNELFISDALGTLYSFNRTSSKFSWKMRAGAEIIDIKRGKQGLFVSSNDNYVYLVSESTGNVVWRKRLAGRASLALSDKEDFLFTLALDTLTVTRAAKGDTANQVYLDENTYATASPVLIGDGLIIPFDKGFTVYSFVGCRR